MIKVESMGVKKHTVTKHEVGNEDLYWGDHLYLEKEIKEIGEISQEKIVIQLYDHNKVMKDGLIGGFDFDIL